jgi:hypothetical protein
MYAVRHITPVCIMKLIVFIVPTSCSTKCSQFTKQDVPDKWFHFDEYYAFHVLSAPQNVLGKLWNSDNIRNG